MLPQIFTQKLLTWHATHHRPMPWKGERDPYKIWLSETMLQQTRVEQVFCEVEKQENKKKRRFSGCPKIAVFFEQPFFKTINSKLPCQNGRLKSRCRPLF